MTDPVIQTVPPAVEDASDSERVLWTAWCDYFATGEGRSIMACIAYARTEAEIKKWFAEKFDAYYAIGCEAAKGVQRNEYAEFLWSKSALDEIEHIGKLRGWVDAYSWMHVNFS